MNATAINAAAPGWVRQGRNFYRLEVMSPGRRRQAERDLDADGYFVALGLPPRREAPAAKRPAGKPAQMSLF